jgi:multisubunit Na+/H+ antiporter MnhC subunit
MGECFRKFFFPIFTLASIGIATLAVVVAFCLFQKEGLSGISPRFDAGMIAAVCISVLILCFAIYASCWGAKWSRITLGGIYLVYAVALVVLAIILFTKKDAVIRAIDKALNTTPSDDDELENWIKEWVDKYCRPLAICFVVGGIVMLFGMVVAFLFAYKDARENDGWHDGITANLTP